MSYLLDTNVLLWLSREEEVDPKAEATLEAASREGRNLLFVSSFFAREVATLVRKGRATLGEGTLGWFERATSELNLAVLAASTEILIASNELDPPVHPDPADRIIAATAMRYALTLATRDAKLLAYGAQGHFDTLPC